MTSRGYFAIGVEAISKPMNLGNICRTAHSFGASFAFTVNAQHKKRDVHKADTSGSMNHMPFYEFPDVASMALPKGCQLVAVELTEDSVDLPSFRHPTNAAYILGPENGVISPELMAQCDHVIKIPMKFCVNVGIAAALVMYDRLICLGKHAPRPVRAGGPTEEIPDHFRGGSYYINGEKHWRKPEGLEKK